MNAPAGTRAVLLTGLPDDGQVRVAMDGAGAVHMLLPGTGSFSRVLPEAYGQVEQLVLPQPPGRHSTLPNWPVFNHMADPDRYERALLAAEDLLRPARLPCFNRPEAVLRTTRDGVARLLEGIDGLLVPRVVRLNPESPEAFPEAVARHGLTYPVIVRIAGTHSKDTQLLVRGPDDWHGIFRMPWGGGTVYLTQYVDYADPSGRFRKARVIMVGDCVFPHGFFAGREWSMNGLVADPAFDCEEQAWLERFEAEALPGLAPAFLEMARRLDLDFFGVDFGYTRDGRVVLFEATASMDFFSRGFRKQVPPAVDTWLARMREAFLSLASHPSRWRHAEALRNGKA